jgi:CubicO group peptidase (beta-lactamase class C family)
MSEKSLERKMSQGLRGVTPGVSLQAFHRGVKKIDIRAGKTYRYYDWASLTKIIFSTSAFMKLVSLKKASLNSQVKEFLTWYPVQKPMKSFLSHTAGLTWWKPYYRELDLELSREARWFQLSTLIEKDPIQKVSKATYSDLDLFFTGFVNEVLYDKGLYDIWLELQENYNLSRTDFHRDNQPHHSRDQYAPTEKCIWRKKIMRGEVHDENTWALGGVAPHSGLFGPHEDLSKWGLMLRKAYRGERSDFVAKTAVVREFTSRAVPQAMGDWAHGFMMPSPGRASCGRYFSPTSFGHTGFTGTSLWYDPKKDLLITILSNRVHPTRDNQQFIKFRPQLHEWVCEELSLV